jgi:protein gp37
MGATTKIQWTDYTFNPWIGCTKVSPGCKNCYAEKTTRARVLRSQGHETWGKGAQRSRTSAANWKEPLKWNKIEGPRKRVFCASTADWLDDEVPIEWLRDLLQLIYHTPNLIWQLLTKRPENWRVRIEKCLILEQGGDVAEYANYFARHDGDTPLTEFAAWLNNWTGDVPPDNVWIGASAENQECFDLRYMKLAEIPARVRFWSMEPLLDAINFTAVHDIAYFQSRFHWVIAGGESGSGARFCETTAISDIVSQCELAGVACFVKQLGKHPLTSGDRQNSRLILADKKGGDMAEWPDALRVRQFPEEAA